MDGFGIWGTLGFIILVVMGCMVILMIYYKLIEMSNTLYEIRDLLKERR